MVSERDTGAIWLAVERLLRRREGDWWERVCGSVPELAALKGIVQPPRYHGEGDVATHTRLAVEACGPDAEPDLLWAALLHDVGKAATTTVEGGLIRSHGHAKAGEAIARQLLVRLGMEERRAERITWAVRHHHFHFSWGLTTLDQASRRQRRFVADDRFGLLLALLRVDALASHGNPRGLADHAFYARLKRLVDRQVAEWEQTTK